MMLTEDGHHADTTSKPGSQLRLLTLEEPIQIPMNLEVQVMQPTEDFG
jgi:hypothetical protein